MPRTRLFRLGLLFTFIIGTGSLAYAAPSSRPAADESYVRPLCDQNSPLCTEVADPIGPNGGYTGHDEPSLLFYSNKAGSGNSNLYQLTLPKDPPTLPKQDGTGGTFNFQLHPAFWFGMAMCDNQSAPEFTHDPCAPDSDANIFDSANPNSAHYIGKHPGTAFMEMQFYPPGWVLWPAGDSCDATKWCAALNVDSLSIDYVHPTTQNTDCLNKAGVEPVSFAFITKSGVPHASPDPVTLFTPPFAALTVNPSTDLFMNSGDKLSVDLHDTPAGFKVVIHDLTTGASGSMTASVANGFRQVLYEPNSTTCHSAPYAYHPMYSTSSEHTRVPWAAHSYNVAFSDEIGHFEYCNAVDSATGICTQDGVHDTDATQSGTEDDVGCFDAGDSSRIQIGGCLGTDSDFDGPEYQHTWPGTRSNPQRDRRLNPQPIIFSSPLFTPWGEHGDLQNYSRVAFEADLPRIENDTIPPCQRHILTDPNPGQGCVNPPVGANFYPIFSTRGGEGGCLWQEGGANIPGTTNTFGGSSTTEFGGLLKLVYPAVNGQPDFRFNDFRRVLDHNPCKAGGED